MNLDTATLMAAGSITTAIGGFVLLAVWTQLRQTTALLWWAAADFAYAIGLAALAIGLPDMILPLVPVGSTVTNLAPPLLWIGTRRFGGRPVRAVFIVPVALIWVAASLASEFAAQGPIVSFAGWAVWLLVCAFELWRDRGERLGARLPLIAALCLHAFVYAGGVYDVISGNFSPNHMPKLNSWFGVIFIEGIVYAMASALFMSLLCRERETRHYMNAAFNDSLTGISNHGTFLDNARRILARCRRDGAPLSLIMFDLDHFKDVNDAHGHRIGDRVLLAFTDTARGLLRPNDLLGRYGGEEFAAVLPNANIETAYVIAERVRHAFADSHRFLDGRPLGATVSAGVSEAAEGASIEDAVDAADKAMYCAKRLGRNRVERSDVDRPERAGDNVIRVA